MAKTPSIREGAQHCENERKNSSLTICMVKQRITSHSVFEHLDCLPQIFLRSRGEGNTVDSLFGLQVGIVRDKIRGWPLLNGSFSGG